MGLAYSTGDIAAVTGVLAGRGLFGSTVEANGPMQTDSSGMASSAQLTLDVPIPWSSAAGLVALTIALALLMTAGSLVFLRSSTDIREMRAAA